MRDRVTGETNKCVDDLLRVMTGGPGVPECQRSDPVGVNMLGGAFQLRERGNRSPRVHGHWMVDFQQQGLVRLDNQWTIGHFSPASQNVS